MLFEHMLAYVYEGFAIYTPSSAGASLGAVFISDRRLDFIHRLPQEQLAMTLTFYFLEPGNRKLCKTI